MLEIYISSLARPDILAAESREGNPRAMEERVIWAGRRKSSVSPSISIRVTNQRQTKQRQASPTGSESDLDSVWYRDRIGTPIGIQIALATQFQSPRLGIGYVVKCQLEGKTCRGNALRQIAPIDFRDALFVLKYSGKRAYACYSVTSLNIYKINQRHA